MLCREIIAVFIHKYILWVECRFFNVKPVGTHGNRLGLGELRMPKLRTYGSSLQLRMGPNTAKS